MTALLERRAMKIRHSTVRAALNADESFGFALARFRLEEGDTAWHPGLGAHGGRYSFTGPGTVTYERRNGKITARIA